MKNIFTIILFLLVSSIKAQTFNGSAGAIPNLGEETSFNLNVTGLSSPLNTNLGVLEICMDITHPDVEELYIYLKSPSGIIVELINGSSCKSANYTGTCLSNASPTPISLGVSPYSGSYKPMGYLGRFNTGQSGNGGWKLIIKDYNINQNSGTLNSWSLRFGSNAAAPVQFTSSNLPIVFINTNGQILDDYNEIIVDLGIVDNGSNRNYLTDPKNNFNGKALINIRGSNSMKFEKKSFKIDLKNTAGLPVNAPLCGMPAESDWALTASYSDKTFLRNPLSMELFRKMGHYSTRSKYVEVFYNNEYRGIYILTEKVKRGKDRVDIAKMETTDNIFPYISGGYIVQIDRTDVPGWYSLYPGNSLNNSKFYYQYNYPKPDSITPQQKSYIKSVLDTFETVMHSPAFADGKTGYKKYLDVGSFIDYFIVNELSKNPDGYKLSTYLYKDNWSDGGKIHIGPVWDYDIAWANCNYGPGLLEAWWQYDQSSLEYPIPEWWNKFMQDSSFQNKVYCRYHTLRLSSLSDASIKAFIDQSTSVLNEAQARNFQQFPILDAYVFPNTDGQIANTYIETVNDMKSWISKRTNWLDHNLPGFCNNVGMDELANRLTEIQTFPNPFSNNFTVEYKLNDAAQTTFQLRNLLGQVMSETSTKYTAAGTHLEEINTEALTNGTYLLTIKIGYQIYYRKIVKIF